MQIFKEATKRNWNWIFIIFLILTIGLVIIPTVKGNDSLLDFLPAILAMVITLILQEGFEQYEKVICSKPDCQKKFYVKKPNHSKISCPYCEGNDTSSKER